MVRNCRLPKGELYKAFVRTEAELKATLYSIGDGVISVDMDGRVVMINPVAERLTGWSETEARSKPLTEVFNIVNEETRAKVENPVRRILRDGTVIGLANHTILISRDGTERAISDCGAPIYDREGRMAGVVLVFRDQTEERKAQRAMAEARSFAESIVATIREPLVILDASLRVISANRAFYRVFQVTPEETEGKLLYELGNGQWDIPELRKLLEEILPLNTSFDDYVVEYEFPGIGQKTMLLNPRRIYREENKTDMILLAIEDITERKSMEETLSSSEKRYRTVVESTSDAILLLDADRKIVSCNQAFSNLFGYDRSEVEGKSARITHPSDESYRSLGEIAYPVVRKDGFFRGEWNFVRKDGKEIQTEFALSAIRSSDGSISGLVSVIRDITERKHLEEQFRQSQKMEAIGQLAGGVAHDFNNILTVIKGVCQLSLLDIKEGDPLYENLKEIERSAERAANLTRQLLAFSRKQILEPQVLNLNGLIKDLDKMLHRLLGEDIEIAIFLEEGLGRVRVDPGQIEQVIINLSVNARDAMPRGGKLTIETTNMELDEEYARRHISVKPGSYVMLSISDTGVGMRPEIKERIFEPFFTTKKMGKGTGLGLSTVYGIVKQSGGNIWVYSEPGHGTTFKIYLPRVDEPLEKPQKEAMGEIPKGSETILVVEDEETVRKLAVRLLKKQGYEVLEAQDGGRAFMLCEEYREPIHLILTDVVMPGMSGRKLVERLKEIHPEAKALYMSGYTDNVILHHGILEKGIEFIQKPFTLESLSRKVREVLDTSNPHPFP